MNEIDLRNINLIGFKIGVLFKKIKDIITKDELEYFIDYTNQFEALFPLLNPTAYMNLPNGLIDKAKKRARLLLKVFEVI